MWRSRPSALDWRPNNRARTVARGPGRTGPIAAGRPKPAARTDLVRLVYVSAATRTLDAADLEAIAASSARNNAARGLTGLLIHGGSRFYGVLEGPRRRVFARMETIILDPRHQALQIIREDAITAQRFANWSFGRIPDAENAPDGSDALESFILGLAGRF